MKRINELNSSYDPLHYVILFPTGEPGYHINIRNNTNGKKLSTKDFYAYRLMVRLNSDWLHKSGRLFQQYNVDMYAKIESDRLLFIKLNQKQLRQELYSGLTDSTIQDCEGIDVGKRFVLPSSFIGSPRHMHQLYQDAMSIVRHHGKPDIFSTFTCNPWWIEITRELLPGQLPTDRPDLCVRVFYLKLKALLKDLYENHVLGKVMARIRVIEFQKRGKFFN